MKVKLLGNTTKKHLEKRIRIIAGAAKLSRFPGSVFEVLETCNDYEANLKLIKRVLNMGHETIIEHDYFVFAFSDVTPIIEQTIIGFRLTSFTIKSGRMVDFRNVGYYVPDFRTPDGVVHPNNKELQKKYKLHMDYLFKEYGYFVDNNVNVEDARFVLPYSFYTNIVMGMDARELEKMLISFLYGKLNRIAEIKEFGEKMLKEIKNTVPYLYDKVKEYKPPYKFDNPDNIKFNKPEIKIFDKLKLLNYTKNCDDEVLTIYYMGKYQCDRTMALNMIKEASAKDDKFREKLMKHILTKSENRELEYINFQIQASFALIILKHFTRQRMHSLIVPDFVPIWDLNNYFIPPSIESFNPSRFHEVQAKNIEMYEYFKNKNIMEEDLIYFYLCGHAVTVTTNINGRSFFSMAKIRACNKAQWQIRHITKDLIKQIEKVAPLYGSLLGPSCKLTGVCPEGKESCRITNKV